MQTVVPSVPVIVGLALVALVAGLIDAIAGGGGVLTVPALLAAGLPPHVALGTNKGSSVWGTAAATATFARKGRLRLRRTLLGLAAGGIGAAFGARLQLSFAPGALRPIVLALLAFVAIALAVKRPMPVAIEASPRARAAGLAFAIALALALGVYDGFFGPGTGTFLIVAEVTFLGATLTEATADAKPVNLGSNVVSLATFAFSGTVLWRVALPMALGNVVGGALGARFAMKGGDRLVRLAVIGVSLVLVAKLSWDLTRG